MSNYPVRVGFTPDAGQGRLWGIPVLGSMIRLILVIPQAILLVILGLAVCVAMLVSWIPVLLTGRMAGWGYGLLGGYLRLSVRVSAYVLLVTGAYPPFGPGGEHAVGITFDETEEQNRLWGLPLIGVAVRAILLIPHLIAIWLLGFLIGFLMAFTWVPVLFGGRTSDWVIEWLGGYYRWITRVCAYAMLLTGTYPPLSLRD